MQQILSIWSSLDPRRRVIVGMATIAMFAAVLGLSRLVSQSSMSLLYAGLEPGAAGDVVTALDQSGVSYEIRGSAIFVDAGKRDTLRMTLASEGLPANDGQGYEILDSLSGFGTTSQMFDAAYWRAKEGELGRTIMANPLIRHARVHISNPSSNPFQRDLKPSASVTVTTAAGSVPVAQAKAMKFLVASAVAGLTPEEVSVIDSRGGLVGAGDDIAWGSAGAQSREADMKHNIERMLEARVGPGNVVVEVSVEMITERESIVERRFDPQNRVAISSETEERSTTSRGTQGSGVSVASNLPSGNAAAGDSSSASENSETRERVNYEVSETTREILRAPGAVKRISVAVLVDGLRPADPGSGAAPWQPRSADELDALRELVASAIGFDADRGDTLTLKSMAFDAPAPDSAPENASFLDGSRIDTMALIQIAVLSLVALALGLFVVRPILAVGTRPAPAALAPPPRPDQPDSLGGHRTQALASGDPIAPALTGEIDDSGSPLPRMAVVSDSAANGSDPAAAGSPAATDPVSRLRRLTSERREETVEILRSWMEEAEESV